MAKIEVPTTQKVFIQYETAGLMLRAMAWCIDCGVVFIFFIAIYFLFSSANFFQNETVLLVVAVLFMLINFLYSLIIEIATNGQSVGKKATGIAVIKLNGNALELKDYMVRWAYRAIDFGLSFFAIGFISILMSEKNQRLGDMIANTTVIRLKSDRVITLEDLQNLPDKEEYAAKYPLVTMYNDRQMLALKNLLTRYRQYGGSTYAALLHETAATLKGQMQLTDLNMEDEVFVREIISEYVILTR
jgi:uncharacterized RDD family membrane protein YckC